MSIKEIILPFLMAGAVAYLLGSISFSIIFTGIFTGKDVRSQGSGNAGATNVLRAAGKLPAMLTFACDFLKCVTAVFAAGVISHLFRLPVTDKIVLNISAGILCMIGHIFPVYFKFKGGKAVTAGAALMLMIDWRCFLVVMAVFTIMIFATRIVSLSSISAAVAFPLVIFIFHNYKGGHAGYYTVGAALCSLLVIYMHRANISRLIHGSEPRLGKNRA